MIWKMAFRNIWRNKRRTFITAASVLFAGFLTITMSSIETGMWENMLQSVIDQSTGQVQVQSTKYFDEPTLDNSFSISKEALEAIQTTKNVKGINPRIESFSLAAFGEKTKPVYVLGVDPLMENNMTGLSSKMIAGTYLDVQKGSGILLGAGLATNLGIQTGDSLAFFGQGYRGVFSVGMMPVRGIVKFPLDEMNDQMVYMNHADAWELFQAPDLYTQLMVRTKNNQYAEQVKEEVVQKLNSDELKVYGWRELIPELVEAKEMDEATTVITMLILYLVVSFGMFGTLLMLMNERKYEMGVLVAIGMKRRQLMFMVWLEFWLIAILGLAMAMILSFVITGYLKLFPIPLEGMQDVYQQFGFEAVLTATVDVKIFIRELLKVTIIISLLSLYPVWKIYTLNPISAMRS
jgi:putative ABC transport system permease protein